MTQYAKEKEQKLYQLECLAREVEDQKFFLPITAVMELLDCSRTRVDDFIADKRLKTFLFRKRRYIGYKSLVEFIKVDRPSGRPSRTQNRADWSSVDEARITRRMNAFPNDAEVLAAKAGLIRLK